MGEETKLLSRDEILGRNGDLPSAFVSVPNWGGSVRVRTLTAAERDRFDVETDEIRKAGGNTLENLRPRIVAWCVVDAEGRRLFSAADVEALGRKSNRDIMRVYKVAADLNGFGDEEDDDEGDRGN